uniref:GTP-binding protein GEM n=1 Tax=Panagrellus redivivus TaxID=6233 RepID=A0A7E4VTM0_PANRE
MKKAKEAPSKIAPSFDAKTWMPFNFGTQHSPPPSGLDWSHYSNASTKSTPHGSPKRHRAAHAAHLNMWQYSPARSQSFRHRSRPPVEVRRNVYEDTSSNGHERRRSTPTVSRRCSLQRTRLAEPPRTDVWPEPKQMSEIEERFLRLPDSEDYTRVRQFRIDAKGGVVSRGDSFRRKRNNKSDNNSPSPFPQSESESPRDTTSRSTSVSSQVDSAKFSSSPGAVPVEEDEPSTSHPASFKIFVLGTTGVGKTSLISQFSTSEYRNAFANEDDIDDDQNMTVSVSIGGAECELKFIELNAQSDEWKGQDAQAFLLVYSIDSKSSFRAVLNIIEDLRAEHIHTPIILAGNKIDLERKRAIATNEVRSAAHQHGVANFDISVALNHDVDELLIGIVAEIKESIAMPVVPISPKTKTVTVVEDENTPQSTRSASIHEPEEFHAAIRRFSQRKKRQMGVSVVDVDSGKCTSFSPGGLFAKFRQWRRAKC